MRYIIHTTFKCNLQCEYCYVNKSNFSLSPENANSIINFIYKHTPSKEKIEILFTGGEPLIEFELLKQIISQIKTHLSFNVNNIKFSIITNGTIFNKDIIQFLADNNFSICISCDGPEYVHDVMRRFPDKVRSFHIVEKNLKEAVKIFPALAVQATYHPLTFKNLPQVIEYLTSIGIRNISINPDFSAKWSKKEADLLPVIYQQIANWYLNYSQKDKPIFINTIDKKIEIIQQGGYTFSDRCQPGTTAMAFSPQGDIYPCERFITDFSNKDSCIGDVFNGIRQEKINIKRTPNFDSQEKCIFCDFKDFCMNWCCCSNYLTSGFYNKTGPFLCASEKTAINTALHIYKTLKGKSFQKSFFA